MYFFILFFYFFKNELISFNVLGVTQIVEGNLLFLSSFFFPYAVFPYHYFQNLLKSVPYLILEIKNYTSIHLVISHSMNFLLLQLDS